MEPISQMPYEESTYLEWNGQLYIDFFLPQKRSYTLIFSGMNQFPVNLHLCICEG